MSVTGEAGASYKAHLGVVALRRRFPQIFPSTFGGWWPIQKGGERHGCQVWQWRGVAVAQHGHGLTNTVQSKTFWWADLPCERRDES
jgi:hypothetical protein